MAKSQTYLKNFQPLDCGAPLPQSFLLDWAGAALRRAYPNPTPEVERAIELYGRFRESEAVTQRVAVLPDLGHSGGSSNALFRETGDGRPWSHPSLDARLAIFSENARRLANEAYPIGSPAPDHLIQVSCTGYESPHAIQRVIANNGWGFQTRALHLGHMGCYAAVPATHVASRLLSPRRSTQPAPPLVSLFLVELCSLHYRPTEYSAEQVVMNTLFADGAIRFDLSTEPERSSLALIDSAEQIVPGTASEMTWTMGESAFSMTLSARVPLWIARGLRQFVTGFLSDLGVSREAISRVAVHPGGPKIIDSVETSLELSPAQTAHSRAVLKHRGNMSSCTLPHIWSEMAQDPSVKPGEHILSLAFGPGLTIAANLLRKE